jgi:hypothetical protein
MKRTIEQNLAIRLFALAIGAVWPCACPAWAADSLETGWTNPPPSARIRAYWWWLNGGVTKAAITRDLEEMKAKGWGGALICDADGSSQDGNDRAPHGPTFFTPEWRQLYKHALQEANRLGLEMSLNIQSGWNLGGPMVTADDAAKKLTWSEKQVRGPARFEEKLPAPQSRDAYYRDWLVVAYPLKTNAASVGVFQRITASSAQSTHPAADAAEGNPASFWVSDGSEVGQGPTRQRPVWLQFEFAAPVTANTLALQPRAGYGPRECELQVSEDGRTFRTVSSFTGSAQAETNIRFEEARGRFFRLLILGAHDPRFPDKPRNVQIAELKLSGPQGAWPAGGASRPIQNWQEKAVHKTLHFSAPDTTPLLIDFAPRPGEEDAAAARVLNLTSQLDKDGTLRWDVPEGAWQILRVGCTIGDHARVSTCSQGWDGYALDVLDAGAFQRYWDAVVEPLILDAGSLAGKALKYLHTDSWEVEAVNWTPTLREAFRQRRGYDLLPFLPVLTGRIINNRDESNRFLHDFAKTLGDLAIDNHYRLFRDGARRHGLEIHPESGGPHASPIDAQRCLGYNDVPMSEFWAWSWRHRVGDSNRFFVKQPASAAHTSGRRLVAAEGFTTIGPHWQETLWDNLKPSFDQALCEGFNLLFWHAFVCSPAEQGLPGLQYFAGTHFNPNTTWWAKSAPFIASLNRCQFLLQRGLFVADACYYYGDHVPNFAQLKRTDPAGVLPGHDYDVLTEDALLNRLSVKDGRLALPDGMSYRLLVLPRHRAISLAVLRRIRALVQDGATVIGPKPAAAAGLTDYPRSDAEVTSLANELWGDGVSVPPPGAVPSSEAPAGERAVARGRIIWGRTARQVFQADGVPADFEFTGADPLTSLDYIHRTDAGADIFFVANRSNRWEQVRCTFRVAAKAPELWDPVNGVTRFAEAHTEENGRISVPIEMPPFGSMFVVFREPAARHPATARINHPSLDTVATLDGAWSVRFDPQWGGPASAEFQTLRSWTEHNEPGIRFYSGTATYRKTFDAPSGPPAGLWLDLGKVRELAEVRLNGQSLGVLWAPPFRVEIGQVLQPGPNTIEVEVVNFWPNRVIGDQSLPPDRRLTRTNIRKLTKDTPLMESGLMGPVRLMRANGTASSSP